MFTGQICHNAFSQSFKFSNLAGTEPRDSKAVERIVQTYRSPFGLGPAWLKADNDLMVIS